MTNAGFLMTDPRLRAFALCLLVSAGCLLTSSGCVVAPTVPVKQPEPPTPQAVTPAGQSGQDVVISGGEGTEVLAEGVAAITSTNDVARDNAIRDALRKAVEQGVGTYVSSETQVQNFQLLSDRIYSQANGYVSSYRILSGGPEAGTYKVAVRARVKLDRIENDLSAIGILLGEQGRPRIMVVVKELENPDDFTVEDRMMSQELIETRLVDAFQVKGFPVVDAAMVQQNLDKDQLRKILEGDTKAAQLLGMKAGAEVVVAGTTQRSSEQKAIPYATGTTEFFKVKLSVRTVNSATGEVLAASSLTREAPFSEENARTEAVDSVARELVAKILRGWTQRANVTQVYADNADFSKLQKLEAEIKAKVRGVTGVEQRDLTGTTAVLEITSETPPHEVIAALGQRFDTKFQVTGLEGNRVNIRFVDAPPSTGPKK